MDRLCITGGEVLSGEVIISGAKNSALPIIASSILSDGVLTLKNVPKLKDVETICMLLAGMGAVIEFNDGRLYIDFKELAGSRAPYELVRTMRASILVLGPLLARCGEAYVSLPGGCLIGARPVNIHLDCLEKMGAEITLEHGYIHAQASKLRGVHLYLDFPTVTGTENLMMAAVLAEGTTVIENAACEPEIVDLASCLVGRGARITGAGSDTIVIEGVERIGSGGYSVMPDRIEAGTFLTAAAITSGDVMAKDCVASHMEAVLLKLSEAGCEVKSYNDGVRVTGKKNRKSFNVKTMPYPGFATDMQAQMMSLAAVSEGTSMFTETVFENRFNHVQELVRMGADMTVNGRTVIVKGVNSLKGAEVMASDLRASASLIIAGLAAEGDTMISRIYHLDRGYEKIEEKLSNLGAKVKREHAG